MGQAKPTTGRRWDTDERGRGVGDAKTALPELHRLGESMAQDGWVAEEPDAHLLPHLLSAAAALGVRVLGTQTTDAAFEVEVGRDGRSQAEVRASALALVGAIAEASTHVRQASDGDFVVVTGMLPGDSTTFEPHGHLLRIRFV